MLPCKFSEVVFIFVFLIFPIKVESQRIVFRQDDDYQSPSPVSIEPPDSLAACDSRSYCVPIRRCRILRNRTDWRTAGVTCERGYGANRNVCCPRRGYIPATTMTFPSIEPLTSINSVNTECGRSLIENIQYPLIMPGVNIPEGAYPWMVAVTIREASGNHTPWCTGFLIDRIHVLSAAHCFEKRDVGLYSIRFGKVNQNEGEDYPIVRIVVPEGYRTGFFYDDIAILTLNSEVNGTNFIPICLPDEQITKKDLTDMGATLVGWRFEYLTGSRRGDLKYNLQKLSQIPIVSNEICNRAFREAIASKFRRQFPKGINSGFICAGFLEGDRYACEGPGSGGLLMFKDRNRWFAIGIMSFGYSCGRLGVPSGYTRVSNYLDWIRENTRDD